MKHPIASRRAQLLARSALCGVLGAMAIGASSAMAQVTGVGTVNTTTSNGANPGVVSGGGVTDITMGAGSTRSIINWANLTVTPTEALNFYFNNRSDIVVNRVAGAASIDGILNGCMATCAVNGGNIWILSTNGILVGANAQINTGGFLASTGGLTDADILDGDMNFAFTGAPANSTISVAGGASLNTNGGSLALIAPIVTTDAGSTITATNGGDVIYGSAETYNVTFAPTAGNDLDLLTFQVPAQTDGSSGTPGLTLNGTTTANQVFAAIVSRSGVASSILLGGNITATTASGENGDIVLSAGSGFTNGVADTPMGFDASITQNTTSTLTGDNVTMRASDNIAVDEINATGRVWLNSEWTSISQTGAITANILRAEAGGDVILTNTGNDFNFLSYIEAQGVNGIDIIDADGFVIDNYIYHLGGGARTASLTALTGSITQTGGMIQVGTLNVSAAGGSIDLGNAANNTTNLGTITAGAGDFSYRSLLDVNVAGVITASNVSLSSLAGQITESGGGAILASSLTASASGGISLSSANNDVSTIAGLSTSGLGDIVYAQNDGFQITGALTTANGGMSLTSTNGSITQTASGIITTSLLNANAGDDLILDQANVIGVVGNLTAGGGAGDDLVFNSTLDYAINGTVGGDDVTLTSGGSIGQGASSRIIANLLTLDAVGGIDLPNGSFGTGNDIDALGLVTAGGAVSIASISALDLTADIDTNGANLTLYSQLGITQSGGVLRVGTLSAQSRADGITLNQANEVAAIGHIFAEGSGNFTFRNAGNVVVNGMVEVLGDNISLTSDTGSVVLNGVGMRAATLSVSAQTGINLNRSNSIGTVTALTTAAGDITFLNSGSFDLAGAVSADSVNLTSTTGAITQSSGIITADFLTAFAGAGIDLGQVNAVATLGGLTAGGIGDITFVNSGDLALTGDITSGSGGVVAITSTGGAIDQSAGAITADWLQLNAATTITQGSGATFTSHALSLTSGGNVSLAQANSFTSLYDLAVGGDLTLRNLGSIDMGPVLSGFYNAAGALTLTSDTGSIFTTGAGVVTSRLTASAAGSITLDGTIGSLGDVTAGGNILLNNYSTALDLTGDVTGQTVSLYAGGGVTQSGGKIDATRINVITNGAISLTGANEIDVVGRLSTDPSFSGTGANITLRNVGSIVLDYLVEAAGATVLFTSDTGGISQTGFSAITANRLVASAVGSINLYDGVNDVVTIGGLASTLGDIVYRDANGFDIQGDITANSTNRGLMLVAGGTGGITQTSGVLDVGYFRGIAQSGITLGGANLIRRLISTQISNGALTLNTTTDLSVDGTVVANAVSLTTTGAITQANNAQIWTNTLNASAVTGINLTASGFGANNIGALGTITNATSGGVTIANTYPSMTLTGNITAAGQAVSISNTLGLINQTGGIITAGSLSLSATGAISATANNLVGSLGAVTAGGNFTFTNVGAIDLSGNVNVGANTVSLTSTTGHIVQPGGIITANVLNLSAGGAGGISLNRANAVASLGVVTSSGHVLFRNEGNTVVGGDITAAGFDVTLRSNAGSVTQTAGSDITSNSLQVTAQTGATLTNAGNAINELAWVDVANGGFAFGQTNGFLVGGPVRSGGGTVSLTSLSGGITQTTGYITGDTLTLAAAGAIDLDGDYNNFVNLGTVTTGGAFLYKDLTSFTLTGDVTAAGAVELTANNGGTIEQTGGVITAASIAAVAEGDLLLGGANQITTVTNLAAANNLLYRQVGDLAVPTISAAGTVSLYSTTGDITQTGTITADTLVLGAGNNITLGQNFVARLGQIDAGGDFDASNAGGLSSAALDLTGDITVGGAMTLVNPGAITQSGGGITAASLTLDTDGALTAIGANSVTGATRLTATDAVFNAVGDLTVQVNVTGSATISSTGAVVFDGVGASTGDTLNVEAVNGISKGAQDLTFTYFGTLTNTTAGGINLTNSGWVELNGNVTATGQTVTLNSTTGGIIQSGGLITAGRLNASAAQTLFLNSINQVDVLGTINAANGGFNFRNDGDIVLDGTTSATTTMILDAVDGSITQTAGSNITAASLYLTAQNGITLTNAGNNVGRLLTVMNLGAGGVAYSQTNGFQLDGLVRALNQTVSLTSIAGGISETGTTFAQIEAGTLNLSAGGAITLHRDNDVDNLGVVSAVGGFTFNDADGFNLTGNVTGGGAVVLDAQSGSIVQTGGVIDATSIDAWASGNLDLGGANTIAAITALTAGGNLVYRNVGNVSVPAINVLGSVSLYSDTGSVTQTAALSGTTLNVGAATGITLSNVGNSFGALGNLSNTTSGGITVADADGFNLTGAISTSATQFVSLTAVNGTIMQLAGGTVETGILSLSATNGVGLGGDNDVDALGTITVGPAFVFNDIDGFDIAGALDANTVDLTSGGAITQSTGALGAEFLSVTAASVALDGANDIDYLADVNVTGNMSFSDINGFQLAGSQTVDGTLAVTAGSFITQQSGGLDVGRLEIDAGTAVFINLGANAIDSLGDVTSTSGSISIVNNNAGVALEIDGDVSAAASGQTVYINSLGSGVTMTSGGSITSSTNTDVRGAGNIVLGDINAGGVLTVVAAGGSVSSTAAPTIVAARLTGRATAGDFILTGANINIDEIGYIEVGNTFSITGNNGPLDLSNTIIAQTIALGTTGAMTQIGGSLDATTGSFSAGGALSMAANNAVDTVSLNGASITYTNAGSFAANVVTSTGAVSLTSNTGTITQTASTGRIVADSLTASAATGLEFFGGQNDIRVLAGLSSTSGGVTWRDMGGFEITGNIAAAGQTVELVSDGTGTDGNDVVQTSGVITANRLQGTSAGDLLFNNANVVGQLGYLTAGGDIRYRGAASFTLQDNINAGGGLILNSDTGSIQQFGGVIVADAFSGSAAQGISLSRVNDVDALGAVDSGAGDFNFRDLDSFDIAGLITSDTSIMLQAGGNISQSSGSIVTGTLSLFAGATAVIAGPGNDIDFLGLSTGMAALAFTDVDGFDISDRVFSGGAISLTATTGDIAEVAGGYLSANGLNVYASNGEIDLAGDNVIENVGDLVAGGDLTFHETDGFLTFGNIAGDAIRLTTAAGAIAQLSGSIVGDSLYASALTGLNLSSIGNDVDFITGLVNLTSGGISYHNADSVSITGAVTAIGQTVNFDVNGDLTQTVTGVITAGRVQGAAMGAFALADAANEIEELGPISASSISLVTVDTGLTIVGALYATQGVDLKADDFITQTAAGTITGQTLRAQADGDIILAEANDVDSITLLYSDLGDVTWSDVDGFSLDASSYGDFWSSGTFTLTAGGTGDITQSGAGLRAGTLLVTAGGDIMLDQDNRIDVLGASSAGGSLFRVSNLGDLDVAGDISVAHPLGALVLLSNTGKVEQTSGEIDAYTVGGSSAGDFVLTSFTGALGDISTMVGDIDVSNGGDIVLFGRLLTDNGHSVTLTSAGGSISHGSGRIETGTLNLDAAVAIALDGAQSNDVERLGTVRSYSNFAFRNDGSFELTGDIDATMSAGGVVLTANNGGVTQTGGVITAYDLTLQTTGGMDLSGANMIDQLTVNNGSTDSVAFVNARAFNVLGVTSSGGVDLATTAGLLTVSGGVTTDGEIHLAGAGGVLASGTLATIGDIIVTAARGDIELYDVFVGDDLAVTAIDGDAQVRNLTLTGSSDSEADGGNAWIQASGDAFLGARDEAGIGSQTVNRAGGVGEIVVASTGDGDAGVYLQNANTQIGLGAGTDGTATYVLASGDLQAGTVSGTNVVLKANAGAVNADLVILGGGDYALHGQDFSVGAFGFIGAARDITITDTLGDLTVTADVAAQRNLTITASGAVIDGTGAMSLVAGAGGAGDLSITAEGIEAAVVGAAGNVTLAAGAGAVDIDTLVVAGDYTLSGSSFSTGALSPIGATAGTWSITATDDFDFTGLMLTYNGGINIQAGDLITGGSVQSINGSVTINGPADIDIEGLYAATDITVDAANDLTIGSADAYGGGITLTGRSVTVDGYADASGSVLVTAANGTADVNSAAAGGDITVNATNGDARLGAARFTGVTGDLSIAAISGDAILGARDYSTVSSDNVLDRAAGHTGTTMIMAVDGDALVYLDSLAGQIDLVRGDTVDLVVESGDAAFGQLDAVDGDIHVETLDGALTIGDAMTTTGGVGLYAAGGDLTLTGGVYGADGVILQTDGLLDGRLATQIATGGAMQLTGGSVLVKRLQADGDVLVAATDGDASVEFAEAGGGVFVGSLTGAAKLGGAVAVDGITMIAEGDVTFGAADKSLITGDNYGSVTGGCGCGGGIYLQSLNGDATVNLLYADSVFDIIAAGPAGDVDIALLTGDLTVGELAGFNIAAEVSGSIETLVGAFIGGGNYSLTATDFLGNVLTPDQVIGTMGDYAIVDLGGGLDMTGVSVAVQGDIRIDVRGNGALTGDARLSADGDVAITAAAIAADTLDAGRDLALNASAGLVNVATRVTVGRDYALRGTDFSAAALSPLGARSGNLDIDDIAGDLDYSAATLGYGGNIGIRAAGRVVGGDITSDDGDIFIEAGGGMVTGALSAANGRIDAYGYGPSGVTVASATAEDSIYIYTSGGDAVLGAAALLGAGQNTLSVLVDSGTGNAVLGSAMAANIATTNAFSSMGSSTTAVVSSSGGDAYVNLDASDSLTSVSGARNASVVVRNGGLTVDSIYAGAGRIDIDTDAGAFVAGRLTAATDADIRGGDVTLTDADIGGNLTVDADGAIDLAGPGGGRAGRVVAGGDISLTAGGGVSQHADAGLVAVGLIVDADGAVSLLGANQIEVLRAIDVANGGFAYRSTRSGGLDLAGPINASGQTVDLRVENGGLSQSGGVIVAGRLTGSSDGGVWLAGGNLIGELGDFANAGGAFFLNVDQALNIVGTVDSDSALRIQSGPMTIAATGTVRSTASGDAVVLASDGVFANNSGADGVEAASGRWLIYSQAAGNPGGPTAGNDFGGLGGRSYYGSTYDFGTGGFSAAPNAGNRFVYAYQPTLTVNPINQRVTYNGQIPTLGALITGLINGDAAADAWSGAPTFSGAASKNVGTYGVSAALGSLLSDMNYAFSFGSGTLIIDPKALTGTVRANNKTYDGSTVATGSIGLNGVVAGDAVVATATGFRFADRNAGLGKIVTALGAALSGADAGNYTLGSVGTAVADILRRSLTGVLTANNKTYDGTTAATGSIGLTGMVAGDQVSASGTFSFADRNAGAGKVVNASSLVLSGADAANYDLGPISGAADILRRAIGGTVVADNKTYDGSTAATGTINLTGVVGGDDIRAGGTLTFSDRNAGVGRTVSAAGSALSGADAGNYTLTGVANGIADILRRAISVTADNRSKRFGQTDPALTYVIGGAGLAQGDVLTGGLVRAVGESSGVYAIGQGDLAASSNYILAFTPGEFVIRIPPAGGVQSLQMLRTLGETSAFALDRDPSPDLIADDGGDERDPDDQARARTTSY